ncbi:MAG: cytochrome c biogenesis heme-transporting ATPase CcmA [Methylotenera sp.]
MTSNMLAAQDLACIRGDRVLFRNVGFTLPPGGLLYVLGENGSGKSSLLRLLCGLLMPEAGSVSWCGEKVDQATESYQSNLLYIGHLNGLKDDLTAIENLQISARLAGCNADMPAALAALKAIGIERCANLPVRVLSQGQKRRVALARLWLTDSPLWILDEPFAALDTLSVEILASQLSQHLINGGMAILTTHQDVTISARSTQTLRLDS